jgi:S1-C subfamily serine protease
MTYIRSFLAVLAIVFVAGCSQSPEQTILNAKDGVVIIISEKQNDNPLLKNQKSGGLGTGFIVKENYIITNYHVIENSTTLKIRAERSPDFYEAEFVYGDKLSDVAVIKLKNWKKFTDENTYRYLKMGGINDIRAAEAVWTIGHPEGMFYTISKGIIANTYRRMGASLKWVIQTDAGIFHGNSGGPMLTDDGIVIGINSNMLKLDGGSAGFAIPITLVEKVLSDLKTYGEIRWAVIGVKINDASIIQEVLSGKPADLAGIKAGDKIISITTKSGKQIIKEGDDVLKLMSCVNYEDNISIDFIREGRAYTTKISPTYATSDAYKEEEEKN